MVRLTKEILANYLPHGSGIDGTWYIEDKGRYFHASCSYHMMDDAGYYVEWYDFYVKVPKDQPQKFNVFVEEGELTDDDDSTWLEGYLIDVISDTMDEVNVACGRHVEAGVVGLQNFFLRVAFIAVGVIIAGVHIATGYVPGSVEQTELATWGIRIIPGVFSSSFCLIAAILALKFYDLKGEKKDQLMAQLEKLGL